ncbi:hypothetical protein QQF64_021810 [Cirrhinus molitorella]|uniref:Uncharacterized protein n=1 Tax=Cirrhinus molitorella TaxID=172907 RepID=A0ABR3L6J6_9TELE
MKRSFDEAERNEKKCTSNTNSATINTLHLESPRSYYAKSNEWCDVAGGSSAPAKLVSFNVEFQKRSSVASMNAPASMSLLGSDGARFIFARFVPLVVKTASCQRAWKSTCTFYTQQKCFFVR